MSDEIGKPPFDTLENAHKECAMRRAEIAMWKGKYEAAKDDLRDWFAGQALKALIQVLPNESRDAVAEEAFLQADAMLAARSTGPEGGTK